MMYIAAIASWSMMAFSALLFLSQLIAYEAGYWVGRRRAGRGDGPGDGVNVVVSGMLGLLAFVLALTLSYASSRFDERRIGSLNETNAIGTAWLRAKAIYHPRAQEVANLLEEYNAVRRAFIVADLNDAKLDDIAQRTNVLQSTIWGHMTMLVRDQPTAVSVSLMSAVNEVFDMTSAERFAYELRLPPQIFWLLIGMTMLTMAALGYQLGSRGNRVRLLVLLLIGMWTTVIVDTLDLGSGRIGSLRTSTATYDWNAQGFKGGVTIPPLPGKP